MVQDGVENRTMKTLILATLTFAYYFAHNSLQITPKEMVLVSLETRLKGLSFESYHIIFGPLS